jgi:serine/threonine protein kinase
MDEGLLKPGAVLNNTYQIEQLVGEGGTGEVYRAINTASQRTVAIKILKAQFSQDPKFIDLMRRELLHNVSDDAVVRYYDLLRTAEDQGALYFLVMDFIDGPSLADLMNNGPVAEDMLMVLAKRVSQGLAACHAASIFHRDISPDNIILRDGDPAQATLIDFGIAKDVRPDAKTVVGGGFAGKYEYAAPEQLDGIADSRSDIYSFGMTLLAAARGESPKLGTSFLEIVKAKHAAVDTAGIAEPLRAVVDAMVRPTPDDRPQTAADLLRMLGGGAGKPGIESLLEEEAGSPLAKPPRHPVTVVPAKSKKGKGGLVAALLALGVIGGGGFYALGPGKDVVQGLLSGMQLPEASPYSMTISAKDDEISVKGNAPSAEDAAKLTAAIASRLNMQEADVEITAASGVPNDAWRSTVTAMSAELAKLTEGELTFRDDQILLDGEAKSAFEKSGIEKTSRTIAKNGNYRIALTLRTPPNPVVAAVTPPPTETPTAAITSETPDIPAAVPELPDEPETPETPSKPAEPQTVDSATTPETPATPSRPDPSTQPSTPEAPDSTTPDPVPPQPTPEAPERPRVTETPTTPDAPEPPETADPEIPDEPEVAVLPTTEPPKPPVDRLDTDIVDAVLEANEACGPLTARASSGRGFEKTETIRVTGDLPTPESLTKLRDSLSKVAETRAVDTTGITVLNPSVCLVKDVMPPRNSGPASLLYYSARTGALVQGDALKPDDQAVVYFSAPKDLDGYLYVFVTDNEFNTIHLYPMQTRPDNKLSEIGTVTGDERRIQLSWPRPEGSRKQPVLAFTEPYGIAMMFVLVLDDKELFTHMRAGVEDTRELVPDLVDIVAEARVRGRILSHIQRFVLVDED